jgi:ferredoxin
MAKINKNKCIGCGICANICPEGIEIVNGKAEIKDEKAICLKDAANACPQNAISIGEEGRTPDKENGNPIFNQNYNQGRRMGIGPRTGTVGSGRGKGFGMGPKDGRGQGRGRGRIGQRK